MNPLIPIYVVFALGCVIGFVMCALLSINGEDQ